MRVMNCVFGNEFCSLSVSLMNIIVKNNVDIFIVVIMSYEVS